MDVEMIDRPLQKNATVVAAAASSGRRFELHENTDGSFTILRDGEAQAVYEVGACNLESCIKTFMAFLRSGEPADHPVLAAGQLDATSAPSLG